LNILSISENQVSKLAVENTLKDDDASSNTAQTGAVHPHAMLTSDVFSLFGYVLER